MLFAHCNSKLYNSGTLAIHPPTKKDLHDCFLMHANQILISHGITVKSDKDSFVKAEGRKIALSRVTFRVAELNCIKTFGTKHIYDFSSNIQIANKTYITYFSLTTVAESENVRLISFSIYEK